MKESGPAARLLQTPAKSSYGEEGGAAAQAGGDDEDDLSIGRQLREIWGTVQLRAVWRPMAFVYIFNLFQVLPQPTRWKAAISNATALYSQVPNVAWQSFLQLSLHFQPWILGLTVTSPLLRARSQLPLTHS